LHARTAAKYSNGYPPSCLPSRLSAWRVVAADQPASPLIDALGLELPSREVQISALQPVQHGPERLWEWDVISTITLHPPDEAHLRLWATSKDNVHREN
jgi:hypothetical protein